MFSTLEERVLRNEKVREFYLGEGKDFAGTHCIGRRRPIHSTVSEMQDYYDVRSESWQESERAEEHQKRITSAEAVLDALGELIS